MKKCLVAVPFLALVVTLGSIGASGIATASTRPIKPTCSSVSVALVRADLGGSPNKPTMQTSAGVLICHYSTVDVVYLLNQSKAVFHADQISNKGKSISHIGDAAFTYSTKGSSLISLQVLDGKIAFLISGTSASLRQEEKLANKVVPLV